jgi:cobalt-precorrin-7 (C5)-methyltransferase
VKLNKVYAVGVGPGSPSFVPNVIKDVISKCDVVIGYGYTLNTIESFLNGQQKIEVTMKNQEDAYQKIAAEDNHTILIPFTGDVNFSESEVVDRLIEVFDEVEIIPGISSIQVAAAKARVPIDKSKVITMHVTTPIEEKKLDLQKALIDGFSVILVPRPWPKIPEKHFMPSEIAKYLKNNGFETSKMKVYVFEAVTTENETTFEGVVSELEGKEFSDLSVMVFDQAELESYVNFE